jgi:uncharacterized protein YodC (DUF2158 family)
MKVGDVVYLKSGSRPMVVTKIDQDNGREEATCDWDGGSKRFPLEALSEEDPTPRLTVAGERALAEGRAAEPLLAQPVKQGAVEAQPSG